MDPSIQAPPQVQETEDNSITTVEQALRRIELAALVDTPYQGPLPTSPIGNMGTPPAGLGDVASQHSDADDETTQDASDNQAAGGVAALFVTPTQPLLQQPAAQVAPAPQRDPTPTPAPRRRRRRTFDMSSVRRSTHLSTTRPMTQMQRAQRNL